MDAKQEALHILQKIYTKLQALPDASSIEIGGFLILLLFVCKCYELKNVYISNMLDIGWIYSTGQRFGHTYPFPDWVFTAKI